MKWTRQNVSWTEKMEGIEKKKERDGRTVVGEDDKA